MAADWRVDVTNFAFTPEERQIDVGDTVTWSFIDTGHTTTAEGGQAASWNSGPTTTPAGGTFRRAFTTPGRFQYYCIPHQDFMKGVIQVGQDEVADTVDSLRSKRRGRNVTVRFTLNEPAKVTYRLSGPKRKTVKRGRLEAGRHSLKLRRLRRGTYRGTLLLEDDFDKKARAKSSFAVR
jgi:plastocyanin